MGENGLKVLVAQHKQFKPRGKGNEVRHVPRTKQSPTRLSCYCPLLGQGPQKTTPSLSILERQNVSSCRLSGNRPKGGETMPLEANACT